MEKSASKDFTKGNLKKQIIVFALPLMLSNLLQILFNISDIAVVGKFAQSTTAIGSVGSTTTLVSLFTGFLIGMGSGVNVLVARFFGAKDEKNVRHTVRTALVVCLVSGIAFLVIGELSCKALLTILKTKEELFDGALLYLRIYLLGMPAMGLYNFGDGVYAAVGNPKKSLTILTYSGIINVILNLVFVIVFHLDVEGVAIASVISQYFSAILIVICLVKEKGVFRLDFKDFRIYKSKAKLIISLGLPAGIQNAIFQVDNLFIQSAINSFDTVYVNGNTAATQIETINYTLLNAFYTAGTSCISQNFGAGNKKRIKESYLIAMIYAVVLATLYGTFTITCGKYLLRLFTNDPAVIEAGYYRLFIIGIAYPLAPVMDMSLAASRGLGSTKIPTAIVITGSCIFRIVWIYTIFAYFHTISSLYLIYLFSWTITGISETVYFLHTFKKKTKDLTEIA